jgi:NAD(P)-dependent dehydrogenase (short-subunit alcohol dehydrogenase family)
LEAQGGTVKAAVLVGGGRGFGLEAARCLGRKGYRIFITDIDQANLAEGAERLRSDGIESNTVVVDARDAAAMHSFAAHVDAEARVEIVVSIVGGSLGTPRWIEEISAEQSDAVVSLCAGSALIAMEVFAETLIRNQGAAVLVSSSAARLGDRLGWSPVYAFGKAAVLGLTRYLAADPAWAGVRVSAICPGDVRTERTGEIHTSGILLPQEVEIVHGARNGLGRMATPEEVGASIAQLATNGFASGTILDLNGGEWPTPV